MNMKKHMIKLTTTSLLCMTLCGCDIQSIQLQPNDVQEIHAKEVSSEIIQQYNDFAFESFKQMIQEDKNTLYSPLSLSYALAMCASGANQNTLTQIEKVFGLTKQDLDAYLSLYKSNHFLKIANSIWLKDEKELHVKEEFLSTCSSYYQAEIFKAFLNHQTVGHINDWVKDKTDEMIPEIIQQIDSQTKLLLINALSFNGDWKHPYQAEYTRNDDFFSIDGKIKNVSFMHNEESSYIETEKALGIIKKYKDSDYAFIALLPQIDIHDYIKQLNGKEISELFSHIQNEKAIVSLPKFQIESQIDLNNILMNMGMSDAFDMNKADFSKMATSKENIYIGNILQKAFFKIDEKGTEAATVTDVEIKEGAVMIQPKEINFNRPFVFMIVDQSNQSPLFIGTMMDIEY